MSIILNSVSSHVFSVADSDITVQDDFLPRTATPLEDIFKSLFWYSHHLILLLGIFKWLIVYKVKPPVSVAHSIV